MSHPLRRWIFLAGVVVCMGAGLLLGCSESPPQKKLASSAAVKNKPTEDEP